MSINLSKITFSNQRKFLSQTGRSVWLFLDLPKEITFIIFFPSVRIYRKLDFWFTNILDLTLRNKAEAFWKFEAIVEVGLLFLLLPSFFIGDCNRSSPHFSCYISIIIWKCFKSWGNKEILLVNKTILLPICLIKKSLHIKKRFIMSSYENLSWY